MNYYKKDSIGDLRPNQIITTYGPGSIVDARKDSVTVLDISYWNKKGRKIVDGRLASYLGVEEFYSPDSSGRDIPVVSFPKYHICSNVKCGRIFSIDDIRDFNAENYALYGVHCPECNSPAYPSRFIVMCKDGHIDDFPWQWWVHGNAKCNKPMRLKTAGMTSTLADMKVVCDCGKERSLSGATEANYFRDMKCTGRHPFRPNSRKTKCENPVIPSQRGASNVYFAVTRSGISIPPWMDPLYTLLGEHFKTIEGIKNFGGDIDKYYNTYFKDFPRDEFYEALRKREENIKDYTEFKQMEYNAIINFNSPLYASNKKNFTAEEDPVSKSWNRYFSRIIRITRLREVLVLEGFTRYDSPDPDAEVGEQSNVVRLSSGSSFKWLPAVVRMGEGIFIEFNRNTINSWLSIPSVNSISGLFDRSYKDYCESKGWKLHTSRDAVYVLMHTFSHLLIKQMAMYSGYSSSSINEKIYYGSKMAGILLYTGSDDTGGSLGGLVELGKFDKLNILIRNAFDEAMLCANDPECMTHKPSGTDANGASCHACTMIAETSCENANRMLDRGLVVPLKGREEQAYFRDLVESLCQIKI